MALWVIKQIQGPYPQLVTGTVNLRITMHDKETGDIEVTNLNVAEDGDGYETSDLLEQLDATYTPHDWI